MALLIIIIAIAATRTDIHVGKLLPETENGNITNHVLACTCTTKHKNPTF